MKEAEDHQALAQVQVLQAEAVENASRLRVIFIYIKKDCICKSFHTHKRITKKRIKSYYFLFLLCRCPNAAFSLLTLSLSLRNEYFQQ